MRRVLGALLLAAVAGLVVWWLQDGPPPTAPDAPLAPAAPSNDSPAANRLPDADGTDVGMGDSGVPKADAASERPAPPATAREAIERRIEKVVASGELDPALRQVGEAALAELTDGLPVEASGCYAAACLATLRLPSVRVAELDARVQEPGLALSRWPGPRQRLEPIRLPGAEQRITWLLLPPP